MDIVLTINGIERQIATQVGETLLEVLRRIGYVGVKHGCEDGTCGVCTVLFDGRVIHSCMMLAAQAEGHRILTIEGLGVREDLHPLQSAFVEHSAIQCGYCIPAMLLTAKALLDENPQPTETEVREALSGVLCRCTGYRKPVDAVLSAAQKQQEVQDVAAIQ